ncbi:hypothetical protein TWF970_003241 [Orbilia oligospora]|uniref:Sodium/calcium exchanger membrane region domain-containing protein n=1 Tax=Orbilia oligospora TaxID=2813651 RepID=A0A7C8RGP6_ORBOL|nr:hypothetical protein TWF970_003241 [Orbilia oligospora]KAF3289464.1 hypothetical protein TWF970_003241 [Orbilia oligospora]
MATPGDLENGPKEPEVTAPTVSTESELPLPVAPRSSQHHDPGLWRNPLFRRRGQHETFAGLTPEEAQEKHERRLRKGAQPKPARFNPVKATKITIKSTSTLSSWSNILFPAIPAGIVMWYTSRDTHPLAVFILNFIAMVPSGNLLAFASGELQAKLPKTIGATLEIFTGAVVELIVCLILLIDKQYDVVRAALLGSMLANLLLVTGACFLVGGIAYREQDIAEYVTEVSGAALLVSAVGVILPSQFYQAIYTRADIGEHDASLRVVDVSRIAEKADADGHKERYRRKLSLLEAIFLTLVGLTFVSFCAYFMVQEIPYIVETRHISDPFMGLILVPLIEKAAEHLTALDEAWDRQMDLALSHCLGATVQTALLVSPIVVIVGWAKGLNMDLNFEYFMAFSLLLSVLVVGNFIRDRKTNWLEGSFLLMVYFIVAVAAFYYPNPEGHGAKVDSGEGESHGASVGEESHGSETTSALLEAATSATVEHVKRIIMG